MISSFGGGRELTFSSFQTSLIDLIMPSRKATTQTNTRSAKQTSAHPICQSSAVRQKINQVIEISSCAYKSTDTFVSDAQVIGMGEQAKLLRRLLQIFELN